MADDSTKYNVDKMQKEQEQFVLLQVLEALALDNRADQFKVQDRAYNEALQTMAVTFYDLSTLCVFVSTYEWATPSWKYKSVIEFKAKII